MAYDRCQDMPDMLRRGLPAPAQEIVRGLLNHLVIEKGTPATEAVEIAHESIASGGFLWNGHSWTTLKPAAADGVFVKSDDDNKLVFGWANVVRDLNGAVILDRQGDFIDDTWEIEKAAYDYVLHSRRGDVMHLLAEQADLVESMVFTNEKMAKMGIPEGFIPEGWWAGFLVRDDAVWEGVKKGTWTGFSIAGSGVREKVGE